MRRLRWLIVLAIAAGFALPQSIARADAIISNGIVSLGVFDQGSLGATDPAHPGLPRTGINLAGVGDALINNAGSPSQPAGNTSEGWGIQVIQTTALGDFVGNGFAKSGVPPNVLTSNLTFSPLSINIPGSSVTSVAGLNNLLFDPNDPMSASIPASLTVTQLFRPTSSQFLFEDVVTIHNTSAEIYKGLKYRRLVDFDVPPTPFREFITIQGWPAGRVLESSDNGFATADFGDPTSPNDIGAQDPGTKNQNVPPGGPLSGSGSGPIDHGAAIDLGFGDLNPDQSVEFTLFFGAAYDKAKAINALASQQAEFYFLGTAGTAQGGEFGRPGTYIFGLKGVGGSIVQPVPEFVPEPGTWAMTLGMVVFGAGFAVRRRK